MVTTPALPCAAPCVQEDGCPNGTVAGLRYIDITANAQPAPLVQFGSSSQGWFVLKQGHKVQLLNTQTNPYNHQVSSCFQGVLLGFGQIGNSCPDFSATPQTQFPNVTPGPGYGQGVSTYPLPNGANAFEATINLPGTVNGKTTVYNPSKPATPTLAPTQEAVDISCVNGSNSAISVTLTPPVGGPYWTTNLGPAHGGVVTFKTATTFGPNSWVNATTTPPQDNNCIDPATGQARPGIYPYGCSQCNRYPDPAPPCKKGGVPQQACAANNGLPPNNGCGFARNPTNNNSGAGNPVLQYGGTILVTYMGPVAPH